MVLKRVCKAIAITFVLATMASLALGCASTDAGKTAQPSVKDAQASPVAPTPAEGKGLYPENRDQGVLKELEKEQEQKK